jgi:DNA-binding PadR family transcriptional regulator
MSLEHILVGLLREPACGYDLKNVFDLTIRYMWPAELAQIYPTLKRLRQRGWLRSWSERSRSGPPRHMYHATARGRAALRKWLASGPTFRDERYAFSTQIFLLDELASAHASVSFVQRLCRELKARRAALTAITGDPAGFDPHAEKHPPRMLYPYLCLRMGLRVLDARIEWCKEAERLIRASRPRRK